MVNYEVAILESELRDKQAEIAKLRDALLEMYDAAYAVVYGGRSSDFNHRVSKLDAVIEAVNDRFWLQARETNEEA